MLLTCEGPDPDNTGNKLIEANPAISGVPLYNYTVSLGRGGEGRGGEGREWDTPDVWSNDTRDGSTSHVHERKSPSGEQLPAYSSNSKCVLYIILGECKALWGERERGIIPCVR